MAAFCHSWSNGMREADGTCCFLRDSGGKNLQDVIPVQMLVRIYSLLFVITMRLDNEAIICMYISRFVARMVTRSDSIDVSSPSTSPKGIPIVLCRGRKVEVHQMSNGGLAPPASSISAGSRFRHGILIRKPWSSRILVLLPITLVVSSCSVRRAGVATGTSRACFAWSC